MREARDIDQHDAQELIDDNREFVRQINELRRLLAMCWNLVPDGKFPDGHEDNGVAVKKGMTAYACWPRDFDA